MSLHLNEYWLEFDGVDDYAQAQNSNVFDVTTGDFDMEVEFRTTDVSGNSVRLVDKRGPGARLSNFPSYMIATVSGDMKNTAVQSSAGVYIGTDGSPFGGVSYPNDGDWHAIRFTWDNSTGTGSLYVDGILEAQETNAAMIGQSITNSNLFTVGKFANAVGGFFLGDMRKIRFNSETFPLNEGTGTTITGSEGTVLDIYGATWGGSPNKQINEVYIEDSGVLRPVKNIYLGTSTGLKNIYQSEPTP